MNKNTLQRSLLRTVVYLALTFGVSAGMFLIVTQVPFIKSLDAFLYDLISIRWRNSVLTLLFEPFGLWFFPPPWRRFFFQPAFFYFLLLPTGFYLLLKDKRQFGWGLIATVLSTFISSLVLSLHWHWLPRPRPFTKLPSVVSDEARFALEKWPSFPSGHTRDTAAYGVIIATIIPKWRYLIYGLIGLVAYARVYSGEHYPTDVIGGILVGYLVAQTVLWAIETLKQLLRLIFSKTNFYNNETNKI